MLLVIILRFDSQYGTVDSNSTTIRPPNLQLFGKLWQKFNIEIAGDVRAWIALKIQRGELTHTFWLTTVLAKMLDKSCAGAKPCQIHKNALQRRRKEASADDLRAISIKFKILAALHFPQRFTRCTSPAVI